MRLRARTADPQRPYIDLLDRVAVLAATDPIAYRRIRLHIGALRQWFAEKPGWSVILTRELARLVKTPARPETGQGFRWAQSPLDYELFTWVLWYGERAAQDQFLLSDLVQEVAVQAAAAVGPGHVDWNVYSHRQALKRALVALEEMGALRRLDGSTEDWAAGGEGNTLYEFTALAQQLPVHLPEAVYTGLVEEGDPGILQAVPMQARASGAGATQAGGSAAGDTQAWAAQAGATTPEETLPPSRVGPVVTPEQRLYRTLLLSPALYVADDPEAFAILKSPDRRRNVAQDLLETFGWDLEVTETYACLLRPSASEVSEQALFPFRGALSHVVLLLCGSLRERVTAGELVPDAYDRISLSRARLEAELVALSRQWGANWGVTLGRRPVGALAEEVEETMRDWGLLQGPDADGQLQLLPLAARMRGFYRDDGQGLAGDGEEGG